MVAQLKRVANNELLVSIALISIVSVLAYALLLPKLGLYVDDWYMVWMGHSQGTSGLIAGYSIDRPINGVFNALSYNLLNGNLLLLHIYLLAQPG